MFGYKLLPTQTYNNLTNEAFVLHEANLKLEEEVAQLRDKLTQTVEWDIDLNQPMSKTLSEWLEIKEKHLEELTNTIAALTGENEELKLQIKDLEAKSRW